MITFDRDAVALWVAKRAQCPLTEGMQAIGYAKDGEIIAGVMYNHYTGKAVDASIVIEKMVVDRRFWEIIFDYPFNQLGVEKIICYVSSGNQKSLNLAEKLGFKVSGRIPDVYEDGDMLIVTLVRQDCEWLRSEHVEESENTESA